MGHNRRVIDGNAASRVGSVLWAAYGDALGFMTEHADRKRMTDRLPGDDLDQLMSWRWAVRGGHGSVIVPVGCVSDNTQLRLATSRSVGTEGFNVDAFSRVELPVWPSYALTINRADKTPALNLTPTYSRWWKNTYPKWAENSGNGPAARIQPLVWYSPGEGEDWLTNVIVNTVCTHGHPDAIMGACFHAAVLAWCLRTKLVPTADECQQIASNLLEARMVFEHHPQLRLWATLWERQTGHDFDVRWGEANQHLVDAIRSLYPTRGGDDLKRWHGWYKETFYVRSGVTWRKRHGILTTVAAAALASLSPHPHLGVKAAANTPGADTAAIASMVGALLGACYSVSPPETLLDYAYLRSEGERLAALSRGEPTENHQYPDMLTWAAPAAQADALKIDGGRLVVEGLGPVRPLNAPRFFKNEHGWQWVRTDYGQTLFVKRRKTLKPVARVDNETTRPARIPTRSHYWEPVEDKVAKLETDLTSLASMNDSDPQAALSAAENLLVSTTGLVLAELHAMPDQPVGLAALTDLAQKELGLHPDTAFIPAENLEIVHGALPALSRVASAITELSDNYQPGTKSTEPRFVRLALRSTVAYCGFLLDTFKERTGTA